MNLHGPVRVPELTPSGTTTVTLSLETWKGVPVSSTRHVLTILPVKPRPKVEPVAPNLIASLVHPDRRASVWGLKFSPDGERLFAMGYPSGIVQIWDPASKKEIRRIDTPRGYRSFAYYALLTPDWKTLYVPVQKSTVKPFKQDGKRKSRIEYCGKIRVWDVNSGKEREPLWSYADGAPGYTKLAPDGRHLVCIEHASFDAPENDEKTVTVVWDLKAKKKWKLCEGDVYPFFSPDGKKAAITTEKFKKSTVVLLDIATGKQLATLDCPEKGRFFSLGSFSSDGKLLAARIGGKKGNPLEVWFLDSTTLKILSKLSGKGAPDQSWGGSGIFTPDAKRYVAFDKAGDVLLWDFGKHNLVRSLSLGIQSGNQELAISPDGKTFAIGWMPKYDSEGIREPDPDPGDFPQPRVTLVDLAGNNPPRLLVAPHGFVGDLVFSPDGKTLAFGSSGAVHLFDLTK